jgi:stage II sporulation protein D
LGKVKRETWKVKLLLVVVSVTVLAVLRSGYSAPPVPSPAAETVQVRVKHGDMVVTGPLEEYLVGVVAAEMPADFAPEALRAQAVAARTYTLYCMRSGKHADADVCTDYHCC